MLIKSKDNLEYVVDHLIFYLEDGSKVPLFIKADQELWNPLLMNNEYFIAKEVWVNENNKGEIHILNTWQNYDFVNSFEGEEKVRVRELFSESFPYQYQLEKQRDRYNKPILIKYNEAFADGK